jgi:hypothetical protein
MDTKFGETIISMVMPDMMIIDRYVIIQFLVVGFCDPVDSIWDSLYIFIVIEESIKELDRRVCEFEIFIKDVIINCFVNSRIIFLEFFPVLKIWSGFFDSMAGRNNYVMRSDQALRIRVGPGISFVVAPVIFGLLSCTFCKLSEEPLITIPNEEWLTNNILDGFVI